VPGVIGALQASEAVRLLAGQPPAFAGHLLRYQAAGMSLETVRFRPNATCRVCGPRADIRALVAERYAAEACRP
jgi:adenylyltransferase/sulfurtransferase